MVCNHEKASLELILLVDEYIQKEWKKKKEEIAEITASISSYSEVDLTQQK